MDHKCWQTITLRAYPFWRRLTLDHHVESPCKVLRFIDCLQSSTSTPRVPPGMNLLTSQSLRACWHIRVKNICSEIKLGLLRFLGAYRKDGPVDASND